MVQFPPFGGDVIGRHVTHGSSCSATPPACWRRGHASGQRRPQCRPPRRTMAGMGMMAQMFCDAGDSGTQFTSATPPHPGLDGGFCSIRRVLSACRRRVAPLMVQFPPFTVSEVTPRVVRSLFAGMWRPSRRPPRRTMAGMGVMAQMFCDAGDSGTQFTSATPPHPGLDGGFCSIRSLPSACRRRVAPLMVQFPPFGGDVTGRHVAQGSPYSATPPVWWRCHWQASRAGVLV